MIIIYDCSTFKADKTQSNHYYYLCYYFLALSNCYQVLEYIKYLQLQAHIIEIIVVVDDKTIKSQL